MLPRTEVRTRNTSIYILYIYIYRVKRKVCVGFGYIYIKYIRGVPWVNALGGGGAPSGKVCVVTSVASFLVLGGGKTPKCTDTKCTYTARASEASERLRNIYFQDSKYICLHVQSMHFPLRMVWRYKRYYTDKTQKLRKKIYEYASERSERA